MKNFFLLQFTSLIDEDIFCYRLCAKHGCIRPRPNPFERPSTRYNGVSTPWNGGFDFNILVWDVSSITDFSDFWAWSTRIVAVLENFENFLIILPNQCIQKALKLHFKDISDEHIFVCGRSKISNFRTDVHNQHFRVRALNFVLKRSTIGPITHKNARKHKNIGFRVFSAPKKNFDALSTRYNGTFFKPEGGGVDSRVLAWGGSIERFPKDVFFIFNKKLKFLVKNIFFGKDSECFETCFKTKISKSKNFSRVKFFSGT